MDAGSILSALGVALAALSGGVGAYVAIRADLARLGARIDAHDQRIAGAELVATRAHDRVDTLMRRSP